MALVKMVTVEEEMKKNPELKTADLDMLREWHKKQPHLPPMTDAELVLFLHSNYYRIEPTKTTIDTFYTVRTHVPEFFSNRDPLGCKELREMMKVVAYFPLPGTTPDGHKVILAKVIDSDPSRYIFVDAIKLFCMILELWVYTEGTSPGHILLIDMECVVFGHVARLNPMAMKKYFYYLQEALPVRLKGLHFMNTVSFMDVILNMIKPFMKKELMDTLFLHNNLESVNKMIPIDLLPSDMGGKARPVQDLWAAQLQKIEAHRLWYQEEDTRKVNEALRPGKARNATDLFGVEGSFKKLDIDYCIIPLPGATPEGYKILMTKMMDSESSRFVFSDAAKLFCMIMELAVYTVGTCPGYIIVIDMDGVVFGHLARLNPMVIKKYFYYLQEAFPIRLKGFHFINTLPFMDVILNMVKPFVKKELIESLAMHSNMDTLKRIIPIELLPNDVGGKVGSWQDLWAAQVHEIEAHRLWYQEEDTRKVNEALRPGKARNATDLFGVEGSFKKLDID